MRWLREHLSYANVMSTIAVFVVLGGGAYAATKLPRNSVGSKHIRNGQVRSPDLARGSVSSPKVKDGTLRLEDFRAGELPGGAGGAIGLQGPPGPPGTPGADGAPGAPGRDGAAIVTTYRTTQGYNLNFGASFANVSFTTGDTWTQPANALDYFFGRIKLIVPNQCQDPGEVVHLTIRLYTDGVSATALPDTTLAGNSSGWYNLAFQAPYSWLPPPGAETERKLLALAYSTCPNAEKIRLDELRIDVVRAVG